MNSYTRNFDFGYHSTDDRLKGNDTMDHEIVETYRVRKNTRPILSRIPESSTSIEFEPFVNQNQKHSEPKPIERVIVKSYPTPTLIPEPKQASKPIVTRPIIPQTLPIPIQSASVTPNRAQIVSPDSREDSFLIPPSRSRPSSSPVKSPRQIVPGKLKKIFLNNHQ